MVYQKGEFNKESQLPQVMLRKKLKFSLSHMKGDLVYINFGVFQLNIQFAPFWFHLTMLRLI